MKRVIAVIIAMLMVLALAACGETSQTKDLGEPGKVEMVGGYNDAESPVVTDEVRKLVEKAAAELDGAVYTPVAYVSSQIVAGRNHLILCKAAPVVPDPVAHYALVTIYEDLQDNAEITNIIDSTVEAPADYDPEDPISGGYAEPESPEVTAEAKAALEKASETLTGASYEAVALLGTQIVAGTNYRLLCKATPTVPDAESYYTMITVYADLSGGAEITETADLVSETAETAEEQFETSQAE